MQKEKKKVGRGRMKYLFPLLFNIRSKASGKGKGARKLAEKARGQELHIWSGVEVVMF
jgi:hypothetical protein